MRQRSPLPRPRSSATSWSSRLERRPNSPRALATGLALGGGAMAWADAAPEARKLAGRGPRDGLVLGLAQALALLPGVSRNGAALTAARVATASPARMPTPSHGAPASQ